MSRSARQVPAFLDSAPESESEVSGVRSNHSLLTTTTRMPKLQLERLITIDQEDDIHPDDVMVNTDDEPTLEEKLPELPSGLPSPLGDVGCEAILPEEKPPVTDRSMRYAPVPELPFTSTPPSARATVPPFVPVVGNPRSRVSTGPEAFHALRVAREIAREKRRLQNRTKRVVIAIWATALAVAASGVAYVVAHDHAQSPASVVSE